MDIAKIQVKVARLLNVTVDVLTARALPDKFRDQVLKEAQAVSVFFSTVHTISAR